jgi:hypothetical protein
MYDEQFLGKIKTSGFIHILLNKKLNHTFIFLFKYKWML